ncbi:hypothetical protein A3J43_04355 [Candidatus Uhrbacteria bacterium RIFCSPHIGHO2_12_FULL_54_23]|uniref:dolichyl-phosphate beta-glucosyltransferase n=3 Tax=Candidatus Uhriibacteriota TaxID=1752732 RepID=A0A1F7UG19_9BACT|nr:MAG: hypothetical protein A3J43_04355 [Candidatus Uhrbacteria bacterium RIFCSPHIGHO2_12_FULL_54_23]OGL85598.1 MAG: hypothetical protein A3B36_02720 [Candidatus Uhrbacteria bacterium RIFCSPLOWO2_01_FULL_55_36]OGL89706.1 MAG: hypothetical protein A3J36_00145 [Candidatus Uhrbacteria bacterium RIFCSPLOWO2_02_FULL_54_37]
MDLSIIIPAYNEEALIERSVQETLRFFSSQPLLWELIVVNDGSTDATGKILEVLRQRDARVRVITFPKNRGKGAAVREGFQQSAGDYLLFFDADLSTPLAEFPAFWSQRDAHTVLIASRVSSGAAILRHQRYIKEWAGRASNVLVRAATSLPFRDTQCGFKLFPRSFRTLLPHTAIDRAAFDIEWLLCARRNGLTIQELPVRWTNRPESRFGMASYLRTLGELAAIFRRDRRGAYRIRSRSSYA